MWGAGSAGQPSASRSAPGPCQHACMPRACSIAGAAEVPPARSHQPFACGLCTHSQKPGAPALRHWGEPRAAEALTQYLTSLEPQCGPLHPKRANADSLSAAQYLSVKRLASVAGHRQGAGGRRGPGQAAQAASTAHACTRNGFPPLHTSLRLGAGLTMAENNGGPQYSRQPAGALVVRLHLHQTAGEGSGVGCPGIVQWDGVGKVSRGWSAVVC